MNSDSTSGECTEDGSPPGQPAGPAGGGPTVVVLARCCMSCNGELWGPGGINPLCFSSTRFIVGLCLLIKTST